MASSSSTSHPRSASVSSSPSPPPHPPVSTASYVSSSAAGPPSTRSGGSLRLKGSSPLTVKVKKGKAKDRKEESQLGGTRVKVELTFPHDVRSAEGPGKGRVQMVGGFTTQSTYALPVELLLSVLPASAASSSSHSSFWSTSSHKTSEAAEGCLIQAVELTYEARTEFYDYTSYSSMRIHHQTRRVVLPTPIFIPFADASNGLPTTFALPIDVIRLPGWLPPTFYLPYATLTSSVSATVELVNVPSTTAATSTGLASWPRLGRAGLGGGGSGKVRYSRSAETEVIVERLRVPKPLAAVAGSGRERDLVDESGFQMKHYSLKTEAESPIDCVISVAEFLPFDTPSFDFTIRVRSRPGWEVSGGGKLSLISLEYAVEQVEKYASVPSKTFVRTYPIPEEQPLTGHPLRQRSTLHTLADLGVFAAAPHRSTRVVPLFQAEGGGARTTAFEGTEGDLTGGAWKKLELKAEKPKSVMGKNGVAKKGERRVIGAMTTPFLKVGHGLKIEVLCRNASSSTDTVILLNSPLRFVATPGTSTPFPPTPTFSPNLDRQTPPPAACAHALPPNGLPPYVSLFFESQTAREDPEPLPLYDLEGGTPPPPSPMTPTGPHDEAEGEGAMDPVLALLQEREVLERVHGVRRGSHPAGDADAEEEEEDQVEELLELLDGGRAESPAAGSAPLRSSPDLRRQSRPGRPSTLMVPTFRSSWTAAVTTSTSAARSPPPPASPTASNGQHIISPVGSPSLRRLAAAAPAISRSQHSGSSSFLLASTRNHAVEPRLLANDDDDRGRRRTTMSARSPSVLSGSSSFAGGSRMQSRESSVELERGENSDTGGGKEVVVVREVEIGTGEEDEARGQMGRVV